MPAPARPDLYDGTSSPPLLRGTRCAACGTVSFPPLRWGCEVCGGDLCAIDLRARGRVHSLATVHLHRGGGIEAPFTIAEIVLDDGPLIRAMVTGDGIGIGDAVAAVWVGDEVVEPHFQKAP